MSRSLSRPMDLVLISFKINKDVLDRFDMLVIRKGLSRSRAIREGLRQLIYDTKPARRYELAMADRALVGNLVVTTVKVPRYLYNKMLWLKEVEGYPISMQVRMAINLLLRSNGTIYTPKLRVRKIRLW